MHMKHSMHNKCRTHFLIQHMRTSKRVVACYTTTTIGAATRKFEVVHTVLKPLADIVVELARTQAGFKTGPDIKPSGQV